MAVLKTQQLMVRYPYQKASILKDIDLTIEKGEKVLILGPSGGGKSTLALTLNGMIPKSIEAEAEGKVFIDGKSPSDLSFKETSQRIGLLFQDPETQFCMLTVEDEILFGLENLGLSKSEMERRVEENLRLVGLEKWRTAQLKELSGGMKQKLGIACLLAMDPDVLVLDEPTANLDTASTEEIFELVIKLGEELNKTILFVEHKLDQLLPHIERVIVLGTNGKIIADDTPRNLFTQQFDTLLDQGIWIPKICRFAKKLEQQGVMNWLNFPLSLQEFEKEMTIQNIVPHNSMVQSNQSRVRSQTNTILQLKNMTFAYKTHEVLKNINFSIQSGEFVALLGPNGTGKSTLAKLLIGLLHPSQGEIYFKNQVIQKKNVQELMRSVGFVFQNPEHQFICDTVEQELAYGLKLLGWSKEDWHPKVQSLLEAFQLVEHKNQNPFSLSQGQKRRLSVATMLMNDQELLILDEPTFGQDFVNTEALMKLLQTLNQQGKTILMITHDMELVYEYAHKVLLLHEGEIQYGGDVETFFAHTSLLEQASIKVPISYALKPWLNAIEGGGNLVRALSEE